MERVSDRAIEGAPTLAIEVLSPTTASADRGVKGQLSAKHGADSDGRVIETYRPSGQAYEAGPWLDGTTPAALPPFHPAAVWR